MEKESNIKIYVTDDYDAFQKMLGNRDAKSEAKIISSIQQGANRVSEQLSFMDDAINCESGRKRKVFLSTDFQKGLYMESQAEEVRV